MAIIAWQDVLLIIVPLGWSVTGLAAFFSYLIVPESPRPVPALLALYSCIAAVALILDIWKYHRYNILLKQI